MKTFLILTLVSLISSSLKAEEFSGYYVTNNLDTVRCVFVLPKKHRDFYDFSMVTKTVILRGQEGAKKFKSYEIVCFAINIPNDSGLAQRRQSARSCNISRTVIVKTISKKIMPEQQT